MLINLFIYETILGHPFFNGSIRSAQTFSTSDIMVQLLKSFVRMSNVVKWLKTLVFEYTDITLAFFRSKTKVMRSGETKLIPAERDIEMLTFKLNSSN